MYSARHLRRNAECFTCEGYGNPYTTPEYAAYCQRLGIEKAVHRVDWAFTMDQYEEANYWPKLKTGADVLMSLPAEAF